MALKHGLPWLSTLAFHGSQVWSSMALNSGVPWLSGLAFHGSQVWSSITLSFEPYASLPADETLSDPNLEVTFYLIVRFFGNFTFMLLQVLHALQETKILFEFVFHKIVQSCETVQRLIERTIDALLTVDI